LYDALKDRQRAAAAYRRAIECNDGAWEPLNNLGLLRLEEGTPESLREARSLLERAAHLDRGKDPAPVRYNLALACLRLGDELGARRAVKELLQRAPPEHPLAREAARLLRAA
jgi:Flp pilus assembly protein TadD